MPAPDFSPWSPQLSTQDLAAALAAAGILHTRIRTYPFPHEDELPLRLREIIAEAQGWVHWQEPDFLTEEFVRHTPARTLVEAWRAEFAYDPKRTYYNLHIEAEFENTSYLSWYVSEFGALQNIASFYVHVAPSSAYLDWRWPLRIGFLPDARGHSLEERFRNWWRSQPWAQGILQIETLPSPENAVDILFAPDAQEVISGLRASQRAIRANCIFAFGQGDAALQAFAEQIPRYQALAQAMGFVFAGTGPESLEGWCYNFFRELSHNRPCDEVVRWVSRGLTNDPARAVFFGSRFFIQAAQLTARARLLVDELDQNPYQQIEIDGRMGEDLGLKPGTYRAAAISAHLQANMDRFRYGSEQEEATTLSRLSQQAKPPTPAVPKGARRSVPERPPGRFLQHQLADESERMPELGPEEPLTGGHAYHLSVRIGPLAESWQAVETRFPEEELPRTGRSHLLTVVLTEPHHLPEPQVATLILPPTGPSNTCDFRFGVSPEYDFFEGRLLVLHENRVLQTALLRSPVRRSAAETPEGRREFTTEGVVRPLSLDLSGRTPYDAAFVFNHTRDGKLSAARLSGVDAVTIDLAGVQDALKNISALFNASDWEKKKAFDRPDSPDTLALLRDLALHGSDLYNILVKDYRAPSALLDSERIQAVMAREDYHFPVEFCYQRPAPKSTAQLCPHALAQLEKDTIGPACYDSCTTKDKPRDYICPLAFWGLNRVIEWHQFSPENREALQGGAYRLQSDPTPRKGKLQLFKQVLFGASDKIGPRDVDRFRRFTAEELKLQPVQATSWDEWENKIRKNKPAMLLLMVHSEMKQRKPSMEINGEFLDPPQIDSSRVGEGPEPPLVLLLGCGTRYADVPSQSLAAEFRRAGAAIVVSTIAELLDIHAPRLAQAILTELGKPANGERSFGEVMLAVKRQGLLHGLPIALALLAYGDADWEV